MLKTLSSLIIIAGTTIVASAYHQNVVRAAELVDATVRVPISANVGAGHPNESGAIDPATTSAGRAQAAAKAKADLRGPEDSDIEGDAEFYQTGTGVLIAAEIENAPPGKHAIRIQGNPDCAKLEGMSVGGHFNLTHRQPAVPTDAASRHLGDLGNILVDGDGYGSLEITIHKANLQRNSPMSLLNSSLVIDSGADHGQARQPSGSSRVPIACGVIEPRVD